MQSFYVGQYPAHVLGRDHRQYPCDKDKAQGTKQAHDREVGRKAMRKTEARVGKVGHHFLPNASALMGVALPSRPLCEPIHISADVSLTKKLRHRHGARARLARLMRTGPRMSALHA